MQPLHNSSRHCLDTLHRARVRNEAPGKLIWMVWCGGLPLWMTCIRNKPQQNLQQAKAKPKENDHRFGRFLHMHIKMRGSIPIFVSSYFLLLFQFLVVSQLWWLKNCRPGHVFRRRRPRVHAQRRFFGRHELVRNIKISPRKIKKSRVPHVWKIFVEM